MRSRQRTVITGLVFLIVSACTALCQTKERQKVPSWLPTPAWLKTYIEKDVDKSVAFCDEQGSRCGPIARLRRERMPLRN